jgi:hypothetical protein
MLVVVEDMEETIIEVDTDNTTTTTITMLATRMDNLEEVKEEVKAIMNTLNITNTMVSTDINSNNKVLVTIKVIENDKYA